MSSEEKLTMAQRGAGISPRAAAGLPKKNSRSIAGKLGTIVIFSSHYIVKLKVTLKPVDLVS